MPIPAQRFMCVDKQAETGGQRIIIIIHTIRNFKASSIRKKKSKRKQIQYPSRQTQRQIHTGRQTHTHRYISVDQNTKIFSMLVRIIILPYKPQVCADS